ACSTAGRSAACTSPSTTAISRIASSDRARRESHMDRPIVVTLDGTDFLFHRMEAREQLGRLFEFELDLLSEKGDVDFDGVIGKLVTVTLDIGEGTARHFNGHVCALTQLPAPRLKYTVYRAIVRP